MSGDLADMDGAEPKTSWDQAAKAISSAIQHFMVPEETIPLLMDPNGVVIVPKSGETDTPCDRSKKRNLMMNTLLISRADNTSPALSELVRGFIRRMKQIKINDQMSLPIPV
jgi:hypothetical protein